jgi:superfamily I DNA/RNA helicase
LEPGLLSMNSVPLSTPKLETSMTRTTASQLLVEVDSEEDRLLSLFSSKSAVEEDGPEVGEFQVAEYIIFLLALDTYERYAEETSGVDDVEDALIKRGLKLLRMADTQIEAYGEFLESHLKSPAQKAMLRRALTLKVTNPAAAARRALHFRTILTRGGPATVKGILENPKYVRQVKQAIAASMLDNADAALDIFAAIPMTNIRMRGWVDDAAKQAGSGEAAPMPVDSASNEVGASEEITHASIKEVAAAGAEETQEDQVSRSSLLSRVQENATEAARKSLEVNQQPDEPPKQSAVVGIATAAAVAAISDPTILQNVPLPLRNLDEEQRAAALTGGRVRVAAGAGSGKSTTLVARIDYLVKDVRANPARIMACSFNRKAANELKEKISAKLGGDIASVPVQVGTMHSLFLKLIIGSKDTPAFGTPEEQAMLKAPRLIAPPSKGIKSINPASLSQAIRNMWLECGTEAMVAKYGYPEKWLETPPKAKRANLLLNAWRGNDIDLNQARASVTSKAEAQAAVWYDMYLGIKGDTPGWRPPCSPSKPYQNFMGRYRKGGERLGDLDDMLKVLRDILRRDSSAKRTIQGMYDHILVDEAQDLNTVQHQVFAMISEHIAQDSKDKSVWMVGDEKQAIYQFRGAKPELFQGLEAGWTTRTIRTNYRCQPEIVEAANTLIEHESDGTVVVSKPDPRKDRGRASIQVSTPEDNAEAAISTIGRYRKDIDEGAEPENFAVLARTNAELNDYETACIINEIPYVRRGGRGFLEAPESRAVLGYIDLASGSDYDSLKKSLVAILMKPDRSIYLGAEDVEKAVDEALDELARRERVDVKSIRPDTLLEPRYQKLLADKLKQPYRLKILDQYRNDRRKGEWIYGKRVEELADNFRDIAGSIRDLRDYIEEGHPTGELLDYVLDNMKSTVKGWDAAARRETFATTSLRQQITDDVAIYSEDEEDEAEEERESVPQPELGEEGLLPVKEKSSELKGLGAVRFLYELSKPNQQDQQYSTDPSTSQGYVQKLARYAKLAGSLRVDPIKWEKDQRNLPVGQRKEKPPAVTLSTVHSVKGAQWSNVTVSMPAGIFPLERKPKEDEPPPDPEQEAARMKAERNLAYVALTRAAVNLEVTCPKGISSFVFEAGLKVGENVPKPGADQPEASLTASTEEWIPTDPEEF